MRHFLAASVLFVCGTLALAADWPRFRGPGGQGVSEEIGLPVEWSADKNIVWKVKLPGAGASCPVTAGKRIFVTCYSGYGMDTKKPGNQKDLKRHLVCVDRVKGEVLWSKDFQPELPEHGYNGEGAYHGYAASTPIVERDRLYVFFGKSGVYCFDLDGKELWHESVGKNTNGWGSGASPIIYKDLLIVNASVEAGSLVALDKTSGKEKWRCKDIIEAWNTPLIVTTPGGEQEVVISVNPRVVGINPDTGKELWRADGVHRYAIPSVVAQDGIVYALGGGSTSLAVKTGGSGDISKTNVLWRAGQGSNASSPILHDGHLYWVGESDGVIRCQDVKTGKMVYSERLLPAAGRIWASPVLADGKLYFVSQQKGTYVVAAKPKFEQLAHNVLDEKTRSNASIAVSDGQLLLRNDEYLYCIGKK
jgi:outer membrane protein assembly factor BamB